ncbi:spermidine/putrescine transport system permease protein [Dongia mobilis]|uniref:Spermidine/putrescine transport system permease protein n=1 Tax=Dongia mobilis TaxID=578943 RepID=A0A4R6WVK2_9PROT|nr:ABC transporter permease [Dongia mobilis]TDQ84210.1 spermidine/putrescine transport system permease protein [Dongia mobilis]
MTPTTRTRWAIFSLTGPAYLWLACTIFLPLLAMLALSFLDKSPLVPKPPEFTLGNYGAFFAKDFYWSLTRWSVELGLWVTFFCLLIGYPAAYALAKRIKGRWREAIFLLIVLPFWSNALVRIFSWTMVLRSNGIVDLTVQSFFPGAPAFDLLFSYPAVIIGLVHSYLPYMILTCYIALQAIDDSLVEAGRSLGATSFTTFRRVVLPLSLPGIVSGSALIFVPVIGSFMEPRILGGTKGATLGMNIEEQFTVTANWPLGAALSFILLAIVLVIFGIIYPFLRRQGGNA